MSTMLDICWNIFSLYKNSPLSCPVLAQSINTTVPFCWMWKFVNVLVITNIAVLSKPSRESKHFGINTFSMHYTFHHQVPFWACQSNKISDLKFNIQTYTCTYRIVRKFLTENFPSQWDHLTAVILNTSSIFLKVIPRSRSL